MSKSKILLIEDEEDIRETLQEILELKGYEVISASNGLNGLVEAHSSEPDLVLCDIMMPVQDGWKTVKKFRKIPKFENTPFIFLSALPRASNLRRGMNIGADDYLTKPIDSSELLSLISHFLPTWVQFPVGGIN